MLQALIISGSKDRALPDWYTVPSLDSKTPFLPDQIFASCLLRFLNAVLFFRLLSCERS